MKLTNQSSFDNGYTAGAESAVHRMAAHLVRENHRNAAEYLLIAAQETGSVSNRVLNCIAKDLDLTLHWEE